jgi:hypothetical protein
LRYKEVESALAQVMNVRPKDIGAFRGRLRHLRNIGLPSLPKIGSGKAIDYSPRQALEMLLALELEDAGQTPSNAAFVVAESLVRQSPRGQRRGGDCYACILKGEPGYWMMYGKKAFLEFLNKAPDTFLIINISGCEKKLNSALKEGQPAS